MTKEDDPQYHLRQPKLTKQIGSATLTAEMSPCVWMNNGYPLQLTVTLANGGRLIVSDPTSNVTYKTATEGAMRALLDLVKVCDCNRCQAPAFAASHERPTRDGLCEKCFMGDLRKDLDAKQAKEEAAAEKRFAKAKKAGFTHVVIAWVHPAAGDDRCVEITCRGEPTQKQIRAELKKLGSEVLDDFTVKKL